MIFFWFGVFLKKHVLNVLRPLNNLFETFCPDRYEIKADLNLFEALKNVEF